MGCTRPIARPAFAVVLSLLTVTGCGSNGTGSSVSTQVPIAVNLPTGPFVVPQDGDPLQIQIGIVSSSETALVSFTNLPAGIQTAYKASDTNPSGSITFTASSAAPPGAYTPTVVVSSAGQTVSADFNLVVAPVVSVAPNVDSSLGINGKLQQFMATSFQIFQYTGDIFGSGATAIAREAQLTSLGAQHNRLQVILDGIPMKSNTGTAADWDFTLLDQTVQPVLASGDHSPEFQIGAAPAWMCDSNGHLLVAAHANDFAAYAANLVRYYNTGGFNVGATHFQSPSHLPITWWGIFNEFNINGLSASDYLTLYNAAVPAMLAVDPTIKISALELSDYGLGAGGPGDPMQVLPTFLSTSGSTGVSTRVDVLSTHFYGSCNQSDTDAQVFAQVPNFAANVRYFYQALSSRADLAGTQVWTTENNVNADYADANGKSVCNPGQAFVRDLRGTSAYFAAWRPYVFSQLGKAGNRALYHWEYAADQQYGEVDANSNPYLSFWVDRTLASLYPATSSSPGLDILALNPTDTSSIESLATRAADGTVRVMIVNHTVHAAADNNGTGDPRTVIVDTSRLGAFTASSLMTIDATTNITTGPASGGVPSAPRIQVALKGYGVAFLTLTP